MKRTRKNYPLLHAEHATRLKQWLTMTNILFISGLSVQAVANPGVLTQQASYYSYGVGDALSGDVNGDGHTDVLMFGNIYAVHVMLNDTQGGFTSMGNVYMHPGGSGVSATRGALEDFDGDGDQDVLVVYQSESASDFSYNILYLNDGTGHFTPGTQQIGTGSSLDVSTGDVDGDGDIDAFVVNDYCSSSWGWCTRDNQVWLNDGSGVFTAGFAYIDDKVSDSDAGDVDGDGDIDLLIGLGWGGNSQVWLNDGTGLFVNSGQFLEYAETQRVSLVDLDGDNDLDAYFGNKYSSSAPSGDNIYLNDGSGLFVDSQQNLSPAKTTAVRFADFDNDGDIDLYAGTTYNSQGSRDDTLWLNDGTGQFVDSGQLLADRYTQGIAAGDFDSDGDIDIMRGAWAAGNRHQLWVNQTDPQIVMGSTCKDILDNNPNAGDGVYTVDPDGANGTLEAFDVYCDMTQHGGGWSLVYAIGKFTKAPATEILDPFDVGKYLVDDKWVGLRDASTEILIRNDHPYFTSSILHYIFDLDELMNSQNVDPSYTQGQGRPLGDTLNPTGGVEHLFSWVNIPVKGISNIYRLNIQTLNDGTVSYQQLFMQHFAYFSCGYFGCEDDSPLLHPHPPYTASIWYRDPMLLYPTTHLGWIFVR